ncbi:lipoprotein putative [Vibrio ponticus]|nr:lipoprotein putative [Vibrio ponticus]
MALSTISKVTTGEHTNVGSASIELLVSDASSGQALFAAIDRQAGNKDLSTMIDSLDDAKDAINYWVDRLAITLDGWQRP